MRATVVAIVIAATESRAEIVAVLIRVYIIAGIAGGRVLVGIGVSRIGAPAILLVGLSCPEALLIAGVHGLPKRIRPVLICLVMPAAPRVPPVWSRVEVGITIVIIVALVLEPEMLLTQALEILLLKSILSLTVLVLEQGYALLRTPLLRFQLLTIRRQTPLLLFNQLALTLL